MSSVIKTIQEYNRALPKELKEMKWRALSESPFRFYRGTCYLFANDFNMQYQTRSKLRTWICGDLHFENFGSYKGQNRLVYFDINDFDEAILGSPEPELARFFSSIIIAGRQMKAPDARIHSVLKGLLDLYASTLANEKALVMEAELAKGVLKKYFNRLLSRDRESFISKFSIGEKANMKLKIDGIHFLALDNKKKVLDSLQPLLKKNKHFSDFQLLDVAFRLAGTGSLGLQRYCVLCYDKNKQKHYLIDVKESRRSCWSSFYAHKQPEYDTEASRIIQAEYMMQFNAAAFLTTTEINKRSYVVKEMQPLIDKLTIEGFKNDFDSLKEAAFDMAPLIAYAQIRSSGHRGASNADDLAKFAGKEKWKEDILDVSAQLADNNYKYFAFFIENENNIKQADKKRK